MANSNLFPAYATSKERNYLADAIMERRNKMNREHLIESIKKERFEIWIDGEQKTTIFGQDNVVEYLKKLDINKNVIIVVR